jgi:hypothetical protein
MAAFPLGAPVNGERRREVETRAIQKNRQRAVNGGARPGKFAAGTKSATRRVSPAEMAGVSEPGRTRLSGSADDFGGFWIGGRGGLIGGLGRTPRNRYYSRQFGSYLGNVGSIRSGKGARIMSLGTILVIILIIFLLGGFSGRFGGYGYGFGHGGVGILGAILIVIVILILLGRI